MKTVVKTWRNRLPIVSDDLSHWSSVFMWRQHHYQGKPTWSGMHSSCNFPDTPLFWFHVLFFFYYFILPDFLFWAGMVDDGGMKRVKMKVVKDGKNFPHLLHFPARTEMLLDTACCSSGSSHCDRCSRLWRSLL